MPTTPPSDAAAPGAARWRVVVALGITQIISWGSLYYAFALLIGDFAHASGASHAATVGAFSIALLIAGLASSPVGHWIDRRGGRAVMSLGSLLGAALLAALAFVHSPWQLYALWAGLGLAMAATLYDPAFAVLAQVFGADQRRAITALTLFGGFASTVFWPLTQWLVAHVGWQQTLYALAALNLLVCAPLHAWLLPAGPSSRAAHHAAARAPWSELLRDPAFQALTTAFTINSLVFSAMSVHLLPLLGAKGLDASAAAWIGALVGPMQVLGRILEYTLLGRMAPSRVGLLAMWLLPSALLLLAFIAGWSAWFLLFALLYGMGNGVITIVRGAVPAEVWGRERYGAINGAMATPVLVAKAAGPYAAALAWSAAGGADTLLFGLAAIGALGAAVFMRAVVGRHAVAAAGDAVTR